MLNFSPEEVSVMLEIVQKFVEDYSNDFDASDEMLLDTVESIHEKLVNAKGM